MSYFTRERNEDSATNDEGFTLVEVVMALFLLGLIALGALALFVNGMKNLSHVQRQQAAVSLANSAMDLARSVSGGDVNATGTSGLIKGRNQTDVTATWNAAKAANLADTSDMTITWDPELGMTTADQWVPVTRTATVDNVTYQIDTLIGKCYRLKAFSSTSQDCVATNPAPAAGTYMEMYRVRVVVRWDESGNGSKKSTYRLSTLVDPSQDATWNTVLKPFAYDDEVSVDAGTSTYIAIVANDTVIYDTGGSVSPVISLTQPSVGSVAVNTALGVNGVVFTAPSASSGTVTFTYYVQDSAGVVSPSAGTVTVHILPKPVIDNIYVASGSSTTINSSLLANDIGKTNISGTRKTTIVPVWSTSTDMFSTTVTTSIQSARDADKANLLAAGISVDSSGNVKFDAPSTEKDTVFYYYLVDDPASGSGTRYPSSAAVKVTLTTENAPVAKDLTVTYNATTSDSSNTIDWRTLTGNATGTKITVTSVTGPGASPAGRVKIDGNAAVGATGTGLTFTTNTAIGTYVITYKTVSPNGSATSSAQTITVTVAPVAPATPSIGTGVSVSGQPSTVRRYTVNPNPTGTTNDYIPSTGIGLTNFAIVLPGPPSQCSAVAPVSGQPLQFDVTFTTTSGTPKCTFTYYVTSTGTGTGLTPPVLSTNSYTVTVSR
jgi:prepilin-type N-terminal cleavage/methylation domain-containing protein